ncbi:hypothetical protein [Acinetobacter chinensis]|uniref:hypothetical protein n=1 Tax=Acinetobacter chinensis TaxID=2004650 RepID=UPI002934E5C9|nr:hypothetical protein [Acinetobacter chinensis]WOE40747.1 hypothetical protein QSG87_12745 [Acinetobacter chinensis]
MDTKQKPTLAEKQAFWAEQLQNFEAKYWLSDRAEFLVFDMEQGNYVVKDDLDPMYKDDANDTFHRVNTGWSMWLKAINFSKAQPIQEKLQGVILTCNQLKEVLEFGAPDLFSETQGQESDLEFQLETEMSIEYLKDGHSGSGYYCWYLDLPEEGSILLGTELATQEQSHG